MNNFNDEPRADISKKSLAIGMLAVTPFVAAAGINIHKGFEENPPTSSLEQVQDDFGVEPKSAPVPVTAEMPAAQVTDFENAQYKAVETSTQQG